MRRCFSRMAWMQPAILIAAIGGCTPLDPYEQPSWPFQTEFGQESQAAPILMGNIAWWESLDDAPLNRLVALAMRDSITLELARERVVEATALRNSISGGFSLQSSAQILGQESTGQDLALTRQTSANFSWLFDPLGARESAQNAAIGRVDIAEIEVDVARLLLLFNLTTAYAELRFQQKSLLLNNGELRNRQETLRISQALTEAEAATRLEVVRSRARVADIQAELPQRQAAITAQIHQIARLVGSTPNGLPADLLGQLQSGQHQPISQLSPEVGIPTDLLRNRPDIQIAERAYYVAVAESAVAEAGLYPRLSLSGSITLTGGALGRPRSEYFFGPALQLPTLPLEAARAEVQAQHSVVRQRHTEWKITALNAIVEVEQALVQYRAITTALATAQQASRLHHEALRLTRDIFQLGDATLGDLIAAEQAAAQADEALSRLRLTHVQRFIELQVSLGAGHAVIRPDLAYTATDP